MSKVFCLFVFPPVWDFKLDDGTGWIALDRDEAKSTSSACVFESHPENIIGALFQNPSPEELECQKVVDELTDGENYSLLKHHRRPAEKLPATSLAGCMRSFQTGWLSEYPWMIYSTARGGAFCNPGAFFCRSRATKGQFVNTPVRHW